ncbi:cyclin-like protein [Delitschia confertaspora ATCC 74209]|uniref:RNA polymerase II holoenzyme cyclin-like subunit n=1 Tax=Delitschia confertaspora ATCC 74209 TaxID=1513339 RepID=A0A9P4JU51_9PLEO|nr:cyclin-like protein [Delitschia confertaspora ATCC 74209]
MRYTEDEVYRASSQFRLWSFTAEQLAAQRAETNKAAVERVKAAVHRQRAQRQKESVTGSESERNGSGVDNQAVNGVQKEVEYLTVAEEQKIVNHLAETLIKLGEHFRFPVEVVATGIQFLKRFYLYNSPMTYEPQLISRSSIFLANKTENHHLTAEKYAAGFPKTTAEQILAPEYLIIQALRFTFDVRHPFRGLKGGHMEMMAMAQGQGIAPEAHGRTAAEMQAEMLYLPVRVGGAQNRMTPEELASRITTAYTKASSILKHAAILTDAYFLYTPSQIWLSAHLIADEPLTAFYLSTKFPSPPTSSPQYNKLLTTLTFCKKLLLSHHSLSPSNSSASSEDEMKAKEAEQAAGIGALIKKLRHCRDPDKIDLVKLNKAVKRDAVQDGQLEEQKAKRRKMEREGFKKEADSFWGPELPKKE